MLAGESAKAFSFLPDVVDPLDKARRWDGLDRNPPVLNGGRSLVGGLQYNFEGGSIGTLYNRLSFVAGSTLDQFTEAVNVAFNQWTLNSTLAFVKSNTAVVAGSALGNELDLFGDPLPPGKSGSTGTGSDVGQNVHLTNGYSLSDGLYFPSSRQGFRLNH